MNELNSNKKNTEKRDINIKKDNLLVTDKFKPSADISKFDLRVGKVLKCNKHPDADTLYVEEIDVGEQSSRTVCSGLVKFYEAHQLQDRLVVLLCNLKESKFRGIPSQAMILCVANEEKVELLEPPESAIPGDKIKCKNFDGEPAKEINRKNKIFEQVQVDLRTNRDCIATYKGHLLEIDGKGIIRVQTLKDAPIK